MIPGVPRRTLDLDRAGEQKRILQHNSELLAQFLQIQQPDVDAVQQNLPALNIVEAQQQRNQRGFPGARVAHDRERLPGGQCGKKRRAAPSLRRQVLRRCGS